MKTKPSIIFRQVDYSLPPPDQRSLFQNLSLTFSGVKTGLIGQNGIGKSTLLKLIVNEIQPSSGSIDTEGSYSYCPQILTTDAKTISDLLGVSRQIQSLERITQGSTDEEDYIILNDQWDIEERTTHQLTTFGLDYLKLEHKVEQLSGGEMTRLMLAKSFLKDPDFLLLDEPTNNLDITSKTFLYRAIQEWKKGLIVISHDRALLNIMEHILELTSLGVTSYGGNYDHYLEQKALISAAREQDILDAKKSLTITKASIQASYEKREQKQSKGRNLFLSGKIDRITANSKKGRSEKTQSKNAKQALHLQNSAEEQLKQAKAKVEFRYEINVSLPKTKVPNGKVILKMEDLHYQFPNQNNPIITHFNFNMRGPERVGIVGKNGAGKTTLVKLILGLLQPTSGTFTKGVERVSYLDQYANTLVNDETILENFLRISPVFNQQQAHQCLAQFLFRNVAANKKVKDLSGGEKLRALLACVLMAENPPQLLILDEPTNHLDIESIMSIESILREYQGALLAISHDSVFLDNIKVTRLIQAPFIRN